MVDFLRNINERRFPIVFPRSYLYRIDCRNFTSRQSDYFTVFDASGYYSGGIYFGNEIRHGSPSTCRELNTEFNQNYQLDNHPELLNQSIIPFPVRIVSATYMIVVENSPFVVNNIVTNACLPKSCSYHDLIQVMSYRLQIPNLRAGVFVSSGDLVKLRIMDGPYEIYEDSSFYVLA